MNKSTCAPLVVLKRRSHKQDYLIILGIFLALGSSLASAESPLPVFESKGFPLAQIFTFLFLMLGPFKIIGPFKQITQNADAALRKKIALKSILFSCLALLIASLIGESALQNYGIPVPILALSAGIILFLVALNHILQQFKPEPTTKGEDHVPPTMKMALMPLAFPTIVTPYGIATLVVFLSLSPDFKSQLLIAAIVCAVMLMNFLIMLVTHKIPAILSILLAILGSVLGVIQVALGLQIIHNSLKALGVM